jgi:hypothetical protein
MGFDVTFHPVSERDLQRYLFDIVDDPTLLAPRLTELCPDPGTRSLMQALFEDALRSFDEELADSVYAASRPDGDLGQRDEEDDGKPYDLKALAATVAGCRHPYWYARNAALQFVGEGATFGSMIRPLAEIGTGRMRTLAAAEETFFSGNYDVSGFIRPDDVREIAKRIEAGDPVLVEAFGGAESRELESLRYAVTYAASRRLGLIEATDLAMIAGIVYAPEPGNLRAHYLKNVHVDRPTPSSSTGPGTGNGSGSGAGGPAVPPHQSHARTGRALAQTAIYGVLAAFLGLRLLVESGAGISFFIFVLVLFAVLGVARVLMTEARSRID